MLGSYFDDGFTESEDSFVYVRDHLGSIWQVVGDDGEIVSSLATYNPWGQQMIGGAGPHSSLGYTGHVRPASLRTTRGELHPPNPRA